MQVINNTPQKKMEKPPATPFQILSDKLIPLIFMLAMYGMLQVAASFYKPEVRLGEGVILKSEFFESDIPFAILIRNRRIDLGFSREVLAQKVNLSAKNIKAIEQGDATPTRSVEYNLRTVLGLSYVAKTSKSEDAGVMIDIYPKVVPEITLNTRNLAQWR